MKQQPNINIIQKCKKALSFFTLSKATMRDFGTSRKGTTAPRTILRAGNTNTRMKTGYYDEP